MISSVLGQVLLYSLRQPSSYLHVSALTLTLLTSEGRTDTGKFPATVVAASLLEKKKERKLEDDRKGKGFGQKAQSERVPVRSWLLGRWTANMARLRTPSRGLLAQARGKDLPPGLGFGSFF